MNPDPHQGALNRAQVAQMLRQVIDPEIGINVVDLGLIYDLEVEEDAVRVSLSMTTPACPMSGYITGQIEDLLGAAKGIESVRTEIVWEPAWSREMIDDRVLA